MDTVFRLTDDRLRMVSFMQRAVYRLVSMAGLQAYKSDHKKLSADARPQLSRWALEHGMRKFEMVFDESIWPPTKPGLFENILRLHIQPTPAGEHFILEVDLSKGYFDCGTLLNENGPESVNVFRPLFVWSSGPEL